MSVKISIILCCYNSEKYLLETLKSIKNQTYDKFEIIIINDGSIDKTDEILINFINKNKNLKINYFFTKNSGLASARNFAISKSENEWIALIDHDDLWDKDKLKIQVNQIINNKDINLFFSDFNIRKNGNILYSRFEISRKKDFCDPTNINLTKKYGYNNLIKYGCFIGSSTVIFNKKVFKKIDFFNSKYKFICDYVFFLNVSYYFNMYCSHHKMSDWRSHNNQATIKMKKIYFKEMFKFYLDKYTNIKVSFTLKISIFIKHLRLVITYFLK